MSWTEIILREVDRKIALDGIAPDYPDIQSYLNKGIAEFVFKISPFSVVNWFATAISQNKSMEIPHKEIGLRAIYLSDLKNPNDIVERWQIRSKTWTFWIDWYEGLLEGRAPDWALWREVALIENKVWEAGPEAVAEAIEDIKRKLSPPPLPPEVAAAQARRLLAQPVVTKLIANDAADRLEAAIAAHLAVANGLPDELKRLHTLPKLLRDMAVSSQSAEHIAELEAQIVQLVGETLGLSRDVQGLRFELSQQKGPTGWAVYREQAIKTSAILSVGGAATTVVAALSYLTGITGIETAVERFGDFAAWIVEETPQLEKAVKQFQAAQNTPIDV